MNDFGTYGVTEFLPSADGTDELAAELAVNGFTILDSGLDAGTLAELRVCLDRAYAEQVRELGGEDLLHTLNDADIARALFVYEPAFLQLATLPTLMTLCKRVLGPEYLLLMQNGIVNRPDRKNYQAKWHRDLNYQHWLSTKTLAINALFCLDAFTLDNGPTHVLPGTHHVAAFPTPAFCRKHEQPVVAPAGSYLVLDAMLYHRAGINTSSAVRRAVNHVIGLPFMAQQVNLPKMLAARGVPTPDPAVAKYLGYRWTPADDARDWRTRRA